MRVLLVDAYPADSPDRIVVDEAISILEARGHDVVVLGLVGGPFEEFMSQEEREVYHGDSPLIAPETQRDAAALQRADALLFCYPTSLFTTPAVVKSWLERVLVPGVAFVFDDAGRVKAGMRNIKRLGSITTTRHSALTTRRVRDAGRRTTTWNIRLSCHPLCRRTFLSLQAGTPDTEKVRRALARW